MIFYMLGLLSFYKLRNKPVPASICLLFFAVVTIPPATTLFFLINKHWTFRAMAYAGGLFCWTFIEYYVHRFFMHGKEDYRGSDHFLHHTNPATIFVGNARRIIYSSIAISFTLISIFFSRYLLLPAGIITGFAFYINLHRLLHSAWASKWLSALQKFHIQHHLGQTEKCFGVTTTWWDKIFNTSAAVEKNLTARMIEVYFGNSRQQKLIA